jgi:hypothetical protein
VIAGRTATADGTWAAAVRSSIRLNAGTFQVWPTALTNSSGRPRTARSRGTETPEARLTTCRKQNPADEMQVTEVGPAVNSPKNDGPECLDAA